MHIIKATLAIAVAGALSTTTLHPAESADDGGKAKSRVSHTNTSTDRHARSLSARSGKSHRKTVTASRKSKNHSKAKVSQTRRDVSEDTEVSMIATEANNRIELPRQYNDGVNELESGQKIDDASGNLMGTDNSDEDQDNEN